MKRLWQLVGRFSYWLTWPGVFIIVHGSMRTRVLVVCGNYIVVTKSWLGNGKWTLPGGGLHKGEDVLDGALRELYEETGLRLRPTEVQRHSEQVFQQGLMRFNYVLFVAVAKRKIGLRPQQLEILETQWIDHRELSAANAASDVLLALEARWGSGAKPVRTNKQPVTLGR